MGIDFKKQFQDQTKQVTFNNQNGYVADGSSNPSIQNQPRVGQPNDYSTIMPSWDNTTVQKPMQQSGKGLSNQPLGKGA